MCIAIVCKPGCDVVEFEVKAKERDQIFKPRQNSYYCDIAKRK